MQSKQLIEHYSDFRLMVIRSLGFYVLMFIITFVAVRWIIPFFIEDHQLIMLGPLDVISLYMKVAGLLALGFSIPFLSWQLWWFFSPALTKIERKTSLCYIPAIAFCFILGLSFGYFIVYPTVYFFLIHLGELHFSMMITANEYFSFLLVTTLPFGFLFQMPLVMMLSTTLEIVSLATFKKFRKYSVLLLMALSILITPPDFISDILVVVPLLVLYEIGIILSGVVEKRKKRNQETSFPHSKTG